MRHLFTPASPHISRRTLLGYSMLLSGLAFAARPNAVLAARLALTPGQGRGPFYPLQKPLDQDNNLTQIAGQPGRAQGDLLQVIGQVTDQHGQPISGAKLEIWQTNTFGRYHHRNDRRDVPLDPHFQGYGQDQSDAAGAYRFLTIKPAPYPASGAWVRPPHIHFAVSAPGVKTLLTQMYFSDSPLNAQDYLLNDIRQPAERQRLVVTLQAPPPSLQPAAQVAVFNLVLDRR